MAKGNGSRIYAVVQEGNFIALVRANSQAQAIRQVVGDKFEAIVADQEHLIALTKKGIEVQDAADGAKQNENGG